MKNSGEDPGVLELDPDSSGQSPIGHRPQYGAPPRVILKIGALETFRLPAGVESRLVGSISFRLRTPQFMVLQSQIPGLFADLTSELLQLLLKGPHVEVFPSQLHMQILGFLGQEGVAIFQSPRNRGSLKRKKRG
ncbi:hypothetical protein LIER_22911 [Lithospermum erythrorhizon]|uniref:Uncharacterized protein n=1 Tax=Lithospermum erythrorhizon TaxID=34254 RepID=A0AAV3QZ71_LITER